MAAPPSNDDNPSFAYAPGDLIASKYLLEQLLGEGGMGAVFRARNTSLDMPVAIKLLRADMNRGLLAGRLVQEARAAARLSHPAIVRVFDVGQTALGDPFIVMELLEGETLAGLIDRQRGLDPVHAVQLLLPMADALSAAHAKGLVHRDFKPDNVLLVTADDGTVQPKLLDFGIVKSAQADGVGGLSEAGTVFGSPDYMSPEQARGLEQVDARSDLWSFSVVLYELLVGVPPFQADDYTTLLRSIVQDEPQSLKDRGAADHALSYIVSRGLNKDPLARYASVSQMGMALAAWLADQGINEDVSGVSLETKWLARKSIPPELGRKSWPPPPRLEQISVTIPPSSLAPLVESKQPPQKARSTVAIASAALLAALAAWFVSSRHQPPAAQAERSSIAQTTSAAPLVTAPPTAPAPSSVPSALDSPAPLASASPPPNEAAGVPEPQADKRSQQRRRPPNKPANGAPNSKAERLSDKLLAPMTF